MPNDVNGVPDEPGDLTKRDAYTASWNAVNAHPTVDLGVTEFHYGVENDFGGVWLNTFTGGWRRLGYYALSRAYSGATPANTPPEISGMTVANQTAVPAGGTFTVTAAVRDPDGDPVRYNLMYSDKYVSGGTGLKNAAFTQTGDGTFTVHAPEQLGVWKIYVYAYDGQGNVGIEQRSITVVPPTVPGTNVAKGKPVTASSYQQTGTAGPLPPQNAVDGDYASRWASDWSDPQWLQVDLGSVTSINHVVLDWESAYAAAYRVEASDDGTTWRTLFSTASGTGGFDDLSVTGSGRYVRVTGSKRGTPYGYSLWEFGVYS